MANQSQGPMQKVMQQLAETPATSQRLRRDSFDLSNGVAGARTKIASYTAESPLVLQPGEMRLMFTAVEEFQTSGNGNQETFNLSNNVIPTDNTNDFVLFSDGNRAKADSVDYAADSFDYTDGGAQEYLHACYIPRDPVQVEIVKSAPKKQGTVSQTVYDDVTAVLHERNQHKEPPSMEFPSNQSLKPVVPRKWSIDIYADGDVSLQWDDSDLANPQGATATNALVSIPVNRAKRDVQNLGQAVKADIIS